MLQDRVASVGVTRIAVGLSSIVKVGGGPFHSVVNFKIAAGGGTLEIVNCPLTLGPGAGCTGWGAGYPVGASEVVQCGSASGPAIYYLLATGATMTVAAYIGLTNGATVI